jgi:hypothetical protein
MKKCNNCNETKPLDEFYKNRGSCILCVRHKHKIYRTLNSDKIKKHLDDTRDARLEMHRIDRINNPEKYKIKKQKYINNNRERYLELNRAAHHRNRDRNNIRTKEYYAKNKEKILAYRKQYKIDNKAKVKAKKTEYHKNKLSNDPYYRLVYNVRSLVRSYIKKYTTLGKKALTCKQYGIDFKSIYHSVGEKPLGNYHLDHIIPIKAFDLNNVEHVKLAHHPANLRWIPANENIIKKDKIIPEILCNDLLEIANKIGLVLPKPNDSLTML